MTHCLGLGLAGSIYMDSAAAVWTDPPSLDEFKNALRKGLGRVIQYIREHDPAPYLGAIRETYTVDMMYDRQIDVSREMYVVDLAEMAHDLRKLFGSVCEQIDSLTDEDELCYQFELAAQLVRRGGKHFIEKMQLSFERCVAAGSFVGGSDLIDVCGLDGLLFVAGVVGGVISEENFWYVESWIDRAAESSDEKSVLAALSNAALREVNVGAFLSKRDAAQQDRRMEKVGGESKSARKRRRPVIPSGYKGLVGFIQQIREGEVDFQADAAGALWAKHASYEDLQRASEAILHSEDELLVEALSSIVRKRGYRSDLLALARTVDEQRLRSRGRQNMKHRRLRWWLQAAVAPELRDFAFELLAERGWDDTAIDCLQNNYQPGDNRVLEKILFADPPKGLVETHTVGMDLRNIFDEVTDPKCRTLIEWAYENTPCAFCRQSFVEILIEAGVASDRILHECLYDCSEETRKAARVALGLEEPSTK